MVAPISSQGNSDPTPMDWTAEVSLTPSIDPRNGLSQRVDSTAVSQINASATDITGQTLGQLERKNPYRQEFASYEPSPMHFKASLEAPSADPADPTDPEALVNLGQWYETGNGVQKNLVDAERVYRKAADLNHPEGIHKLGLFYLYGWAVKKDPREAVRLFIMALSLNNFRAYCSLGRCYLNGDGVKEDQKEAFRLFKIGADHNDADAIYYMALCYHTGMGTEIDQAKAIRLYEGLAAINHGGAIFDLAVSYQQGGRGVEQNFFKAAELYKRIIKKKYPGKDCPH
jgi:TPR repeat protein